MAYISNNLEESMVSVGQVKESFDIVGQYGFPLVTAVVMVLGLAFCFYKLLMFVLAENTKREERLASIIKDDIGGMKAVLNNINSALIAHDQSQTNFIGDIKKSADYARTEHEGMIKTLAVIVEKLTHIKVA